MSTYRIAFVISEFEANERTTRNGTLLRVFAKPQQQQLLAEKNAIFALELTDQVLELFAEYEIPFEFRTLDQVALPNSHRCGDTEGFGIAFYRENCLLNNENVSIKNSLIFLKNENDMFLSLFQQSLLLLQLKLISMHKIKK